MQELVQLTWVFSRSFSMPFPSFSMLDGHMAHGIEKLLLKTQVSWTSSCIVNQLIQHIIVQDQGGQNNNSIYLYWILHRKTVGYPNLIYTPFMFNYLVNLFKNLTVPYVALPICI